jgi:hypothetical protein
VRSQGLARSSMPRQRSSNYSATVAYSATAPPGIRCCGPSYEGSIASRGQAANKTGLNELDANRARHLTAKIDERIGIRCLANIH